MTPFQRNVQAILDILRDPSADHDIDVVKTALQTAGVSVNRNVIVALKVLIAAPLAGIDVTTVLSEMSTAGVTLTSDLAQTVVDALTGTTPTPAVPTPVLPTPTTLKDQLLKPRVIAPTLFGMLLGLVLGLNLGWGWWTVIPVVLLGLWLFKLSLDPARTGKVLVWKCVKWASLVGIVVLLAQSTNMVRQAVNNADVKKAVGTDPTTPAPDNNGTPTTKPAAPTPVDPLLQAKHARDAQATIDLLTPLAGGNPPGTKPAVEVFLARCKKILDDDAAGRQALVRDTGLYDEFKALRDKIRYSEEDALRHLAKAKTLQATIATTPPVYGDDVPLQLSSITAFAKAQSELLATDNAALTRLEGRIAAAMPPTVPPPAKVDGDQAAKMRELEAQERARAAEKARFQKVVTARAGVYDTLSAPEFKQLVALITKGDRKTVVNGNDERLLLAWSVHYLASVRGPEDVQTKMEYALQYLPTNAAVLEAKGMKDVGVDAKEWAAGPIPADTLKWAYLKAPYNTTSTWTAYAQPSGKGAGLYTMLDLQFRGKFAEKLNKLNVDLPENERVRSLADAVWVAIKAREDFWLSNEDVENLKRDPTLKTAALWTEANVAGASSSTPATFMTREQWSTRPETKR